MIYNVVSFFYIFLKEFFYSYLLGSIFLLFFFLLEHVCVKNMLCSISRNDKNIHFWSHVFQEARSYYEQTGVGPLPVVLFNGMPFEKEQLDPDELETITMHKILETTTFFQRAVYLVSSVSDFERF